jgi:hypothetical protein
LGRRHRHGLEQAERKRRHGHPLYAVAKFKANARSALQHQHSAAAHP